MKPGDRIKFLEERKRYTVRAAGKRFVVCTRPHFKTVMYTVIDLVKQIRSTEGLVFGMGAETDKQCRDMLKRLESGETELSRRNQIELRIVLSAEDEARASMFLTLKKANKNDKRVFKPR